MSSKGITICTALLLMSGAGCSTQTDLITAETCEDGVFNDDGSPILLGEECFDAQLNAISSAYQQTLALADDMAAACEPLAQARDLPDTWSAAPDLFARATAVCDAAMSNLILDGSMQCASDQQQCQFALDCSGTVEPPFLLELEAAVEALLSGCCEGASLAEHLLDVAIGGCSPDVSDECYQAAVGEVTEALAFLESICHVATVPS